MKPNSSEGRPNRWGIYSAAGCALIVILAWVSPLGQWTSLFSFDAISVMMRNAVPHDIVIVSLNEQSHEELAQPYDRPWDRRLHARLLDRLRQDGAKLVYFDIVFEQASSDPAEDLQFAAAIRHHGAVVLGGNGADTQEAESIQRRVIAPTPALRQAALAWGSLSFLPLDGDNGVRRLPGPIGGIHHAATHAVRILQSNTQADPVSPRQYVSYFGPPGAFPAVSFHQALAQDGVPKDFFRGKIVLVGGRYSTGFSGTTKDSFTTPYSRFGSPPMDGVEINANILATLLLDRTLHLSHPGLELALLALASGSLTWTLFRLRPKSATILVLAAVLFSALLAGFAASQFHFWINWVLFAGAAAPLGLFLSVGGNYYVELRRREKITRAFEKYLSPAMVRQMSLSDVDLKPGGSRRRVTAMMTDIEGFSAIAETLREEELSKLLIAYFSELTRHVFALRGTVLQFVGDATYCVWNAPQEEAAHADLAVQAALTIQDTMQGRFFGGHALTTRIGISTGDGLCGNLGSSERFDYAVIGDNTNLAARIESANKKLGTTILITEGTRRALRAPWVLREVGDFLVSGRVLPVRLWEPITAGTVPPTSRQRALTAYAEGLAAWRNSDPDRAEECFTLAKSHGDEIAAFYLQNLREDRSRSRSGPLAL